MSGQIEITPSRVAEVAGTPVRRALPRRTRRTVGAWCFADHMGPVAPSASTQSVGMQVGAHPHMGLQTVTWLVAGELLHRDSLGSEQLIQPGQLNLMTAGAGISHAEESPRSYGPTSSTGRHRGGLHGIQLWVAQPEATRHSGAAFEHHADLPQAEMKDATATVLVGNFESMASPARRDTDHVGVDLQLRAGSTTLALDPEFEYALIILSGAVEVSSERKERVVPGELAYLAPGRAELRLTAPQTSSDQAARLMLLGGTPFESPILMWWNFVALSRDEIAAARDEWNSPTDAHHRFGETGSKLARIEAPALPWA